MEQSQARIMTGLAVVLLVATALLYLLKPEERPDPEASRFVWDVSGEEIVQVEVERADGLLRLQQEPTGWWVDAPVRAEAEPQAVERLLDALQSVHWGVLIDRAVHPAEYGLGEPPVARVQVQLADGSERSLVVGDEAPVGHRTYVRDAEGQIVAVEGRPGHALTEPAERFRDHRIFDFRPQDVRRVTLQGPEGELSVHGQGARWWLEGFTRADPDAVDDLVVGLLELRFDLFQAVDPMAGAERIVTVELEDGGIERLYVGESTPQGRRVWTDEGQGGVVLPESLRLLGQGPTDLGDPRAFPIDVERVDQVAVTIGDRRTEAVRDGPAWRVSGKIAPDAQMAVDRLAEAAIHYRRPPLPALEEVWAMVEIRTGGGTALIDVGQRFDGAFRVAKDRGGGETYLIPEADLAPLQGLLEAGPP